MRKFGLKIIMSFILIFGIFGVVNAEGYVASVGGNNYASLNDAINNAETNDTITLLKDTREVIDIDKSVTLDLNGHTLYPVKTKNELNKHANWVISDKVNSASGVLMTIYSKNDKISVTIKNGSISSTGDEETLDEEYSSIGDGFIYVYNSNISFDNINIHDIKTTKNKGFIYINDYSGENYNINIANMNVYNTSGTLLTTNGQRTNNANYNISNTNIYDNNINDDLINITGNNINIDNIKIYDNTDFNNLITADSNIFNLTNSSIHDNRSSISNNTGKVLRLAYGEGTIDSSSIYNNINTNKTNDIVPAIYVDGWATLNVHANNTFYGNTCNASIASYVGSSANSVNQNYTESDIYGTIFSFFGNTYNATINLEKPSNKVWFDDLNTNYYEDVSTIKGKTNLYLTDKENIKVASIGDKTYASLQDALNDYKEGDIIKLLASDSPRIFKIDYIYPDIDFAIDLNGNSLDTDFFFNDIQNAKILNSSKNQSYIDGWIMNYNANLTLSGEFGPLLIATANIINGDNTFNTNYLYIKLTGELLDEINSISPKDVTYKLIIDTNGFNINNLYTAGITNPNVTKKMDGNDIVLVKKATEKAIYIGGDNASDENAGTKDAPIKSYTKLKELINEYSNYKINVYAIGKTKITDDEVWENVNIERDPSYNGNIFEIDGGNLTLKNVRVDGMKDYVSNVSALISVLNGKLTLEDGTILENNNNSAISISKNGNVIMNGGTIRNNSAKFGGGIYDEGTLTINGGSIEENKAERGGGVFVGIANQNLINPDTQNGILNMLGGKIISNEAELQGGGIYVECASIATISAGEIKNNKTVNGLHYSGGGIYVNGITGSNIPNGKLYLTNVLINNNNAVDGGAIAGCPSSNIYIYLTNGGALVDNNASSEVYITNNSETGLGGHEGNPKVYISDRMLGGFKYNWNNTKLDEEYNLDGTLNLNNNPNSGYLENILRYAKVFISGNTASNRGGGIASNGDVIIGTSDTTSLNINKIWLDHNSNRQNIIVDIYANDVLIDTITITDPWVYTLNNLPTKAGDEDIKYTIKERNIDNYSSKIDFKDNNYTITNTKYITVNPGVNKTIIGNPSFKSTFYFEIKALDDSPMPSKNIISIKGPGKAYFGDVTFTKPGTYTYLINEIVNNEYGYTYDTNTYKLVYEVVNTSNGLEVTKKLYKEDTLISDDDLVNITNTYKKENNIPPQTGVDKNINIISIIIPLMLCLGMLIRRRVLN